MKVRHFCSCNESTFDIIKSSKGEDQVRSGLYYYTEVDFGNVPVGGTLSKPVFIENDSQQTQIYQLQRRSDSKTSHYDFDCTVLSKSKAVCPNETLECKVVFRPVYPNEKCFDKFIVRDGSHNYHVILVKGESIGPNVRASAKKLCFYITKDYNHIKNTFEITNMSSAETPYQFVVGCHSFELDRRREVIAANGRKFVTVTFVPTRKGIYYEHLWCLLLNQEPCLIDLIGIYMPKTRYKIKNLVYKYYPIPLQYRIGDDGFFQNSSLQKYMPPVTVKPYYLFFNNIKELTFIVKNNSNDEMRITWLQDEDKVFIIYPEDFIIPPHLYLKFKCTFVPKSDNEIYCKYITAQVNWYSNLMSGGRSTATLPTVDAQVIYLPFTQFLKCTAHSFSEHSRWIATAQVIPACVKLPPCIGVSRSWASFQIKSKCGLPILYNILVPHETHLTMKPTSGIIQPWLTQLVTVQFNPPSTETLSMTEKWYISLNGQPDDLLFVAISFQCDIPSMVVGDNNVINFPCIQLGWRECLNVLLRNTSAFQIKYTLIIDNNEHLEIETPEGYIGCNQEYFVKMYFTGDICAPTKSYITCKCEAVQKNLVVGKPAETKVIVYAQCTYSQLCALPKEIDFGDVEWGSVLETNFVAYNFGLASINFVINASETGGEEIIVVPKSGTIQNGEKMGITLKIKAMKLGRRVVEYFYGIPQSQQAPMTIFTLHYTSFYPVFQITEIISHNFNQLFNKAKLWEMLKISHLNHILQTIQSNEKHTINCYLPDYEHNRDTYLIKFLLMNMTNFSVELSLQKFKMCSCEPVETRTLTFRKKVYDCPHRDMLTMNMSETEIRPNAKEVLTMKVKYAEVGNFQLCYLMKLSHNRTIKLIIEINSISEEISTLSTYKPSCFMNLQEIFIGTKNPPLQCFWLYNNSANGVTYHIDNLEVIKTCTEDGFDVLTCFNPVDEVKAYSYAPIVFQFNPIEIKDYKVSVPLLLGDRLVELKIHGTGVEEKKPLVLNDHSMPTSSKTFMDSFVTVSVDEVTIRDIPLWAITERMIFLKNRSQHEKFYFYWEPYYLEGIVSVDIKPLVGVLHPKETKRIHIRIYTLGEPSVVNLILSCLLVDLDLEGLAETVKENDDESIDESCYSVLVESTTEIKEQIECAQKKFHITLGINLEIVDTSESLLLGNINEAFRNKPRKIIDIDKANIMKGYIDSMSTTDQPIESQTRKNSNTSKNETEPLKTNVENTLTSRTTNTIPFQHIDRDAVEVITETMTKLIGQVVFSDMFKGVTDNEKNSSPYYCQYRISGKPSGHSHETSKHVKLSKERMDETKTFLKYPEPEELSDTLQELLNDTIDIFSSHASKTSRLIVPK